MDSDSRTKFSFAFSLAVLFHLLLIALMLVGLTAEPSIPLKKPLETMQATLLDTKQGLSQAEQADWQRLKALSPAEEKRLVSIQKRLEQSDRNKFLAAAAQKMVLEAVQRKKQLKQKSFAQKNAANVAAAK